MSQSIPTEDTEDRISALPDPIIHDILSFLPTKKSAATSILSKRWKPLWLSVPNLQFDDRSFPNYDSFYRFVSSVFLSLDIKLSIRSFHLKSSHASIHHFHDVNRFVYAAAQRGGIENLNLELPTMNFVRVDIPPSIFGCRTLVVLRLSKLKVNVLSHLVVDFPLLKTLRLCYVGFECHDYIIKLLSGCPILEELQLEWTSVVNYNQSPALPENFQCLPNFIRANISDLWSTADAVFTLICKAKILYLDLGNCNNHFPVFLNLIHMELILNRDCRGKWNWVIEVLRRCPKLQNLTIRQDSPNGNEVGDNWMDPTVAPECLSTQLRTCMLKGCNSMKCEVQFAYYIMQNAKVLNTMTIKSASYIDTNTKHQMKTKFASSTRASTTCKLLFD
ncbi:putative F-box domain, FBD domain, leucine-rich repeat domain, L domain-containing protein [Medicago truncatula]|uniref:F-box/RNI/FBD-like domain protein n=1 Tax=Medicago truncatula TaxID=3880 RepID=A0A072U0K8_MEDTR|nr:FBD-associated F-box protein At3g52670 [Medicago truncatula]XP_024625815.1 FBD-associated F-box protein At3g52670 [Medicago truncatula]XP_024625816.1 FBD-associated F-box protein At3g52670 [Medicago truncatula]XP_039683181.1 FBD-associated F-box protein At3g52670 [Medicago truncatula]XP_039683182.1 FBD-associated F-box protein At3g52670 [Medicago truncatula]XP_039683183.1 FBD-associated F-box protein At3g52670 [Medicago truncatula]KEH22678.1 F-box/RNI/FBD-like domain protein [Medicago trun